MYLRFILLIVILTIFCKPLQANDFPLARNLDVIENIKLPEATPYEEASYIPISGPWRLVGSANNIRTWEAPLPIRSRSLFSPPYQ